MDKTLFKDRLQSPREARTLAGAEVRFALRAERGRGRSSRGVELLHKAQVKPARAVKKWP